MVVLYMFCVFGALVSLPFHVHDERVKSEMRLVRFFLEAFFFLMALAKGHQVLYVPGGIVIVIEWAIHILLES